MGVIVGFSAHLIVIRHRVFSLISYYQWSIFNSNELQGVQLQKHSSKCIWNKLHENITFLLCVHLQAHSIHKIVFFTVILFLKMFFAVVLCLFKPRVKHLHLFRRCFHEAHLFFCHWHFDVCVEISACQKNLKKYISTFFWGT